MAIPSTKTELLKAISDNFDKLMVELESVREEEAMRTELEGHVKNSVMSVHNLVAYLVGWGELVIKWHKRREIGEMVDFPETGYKWNQLGQLAQKFYQDYREESFPSLKLRLVKCTNSIVQIIEGKTNHELYKVNWYDRWSLGRLIQLNTASPFQNATARLRKWKKLQQAK